MSDFLAELEALPSGAGTHPSELFRDVSDEFWLWANTEGREASPVLRDLLPGLPDPRIQLKFTGTTGIATMTAGFEIYRTLRDLHDRHVGNLREHGPVLDFGCGWGRVIRFFLRDVAPGQLLGTDYSNELIDFCLTSDRWCRFSRNDANPPLPIGDHTLGFIYAYSVFSHFSEPMHLLWLDEFKRVLRPGGALALTVRPRTFIEHCRRVQTGDAMSVTPRRATTFPDADAALARYDEGEFCFSPYFAAEENAWWGNACIPRDYVYREWSKQFDVVEFATALNVKQPVVLLRA